MHAEEPVMTIAARRLLITIAPAGDGLVNEGSLCHPVSPVLMGFVLVNQEVGSNARLLS